MIKIKIKINIYSEMSAGLCSNLSGYFNNGEAFPILGDLSQVLSLPDHSFNICTFKKGSNYPKTSQIAQNWACYEYYKYDNEFKFQWEI